MKKQAVLSFYTRLLFCGVLISSFSSCTVLQWRNSNQEIETFFEERNIPSEISYFEVDSLDLKIRIQTIPSNKTNVNLLFLHGAPSSLAAWTGYLTDAVLTETASLHAVDRPGYGYSNFGKSMPSIDTQAQLMSAIIDSKQLENVIVIGASYGGPIAARIAFYNPAVKAVIMVSPAIDPQKEKAIWGSGFTQFPLTRWMVPTGYRVAGDEKTAHADELHKIEKDWKTIAIPIVHIHGDADDLVPYENTTFSETHFKDCTIVTIPNKGHEISWKHPELVKPYILEHIALILDDKN